MVFQEVQANNDNMPVKFYQKKYVQLLKTRKYITTFDMLNFFVTNYVSSQRATLEQEISAPILANLNFQKKFQNISTCKNP